MTIVVRDPGMNLTPPGWVHCETVLGQGGSPTALGFLGAAGDLNHFRSRYRLARSFQQIVLDSYSSTTQYGYSALFRVFLTWSAFELLLEICGTNISTLEPLLDGYGARVVAASIRAVSGNDVFLSFVRDKLDYANQKAQFDAFIAGEPCNLLSLPKGIRHIFVHGDLTPHAGAESPYPAAEVSRMLSDFLVTVMDHEFSQRLKAKGFAV